jgi:hypothetical protein
MKSHDCNVTQNVGEIRDQDIFHFLLESTELLLSKGNVNNVTVALRYSRPLRWVPRCPLAIAKLSGKKACLDFLSCYEADGEGFIKDRRP